MTTICTCPVEASIHHPGCVAGELVDGLLADAFVLGKTDVEVRQVATRAWARGEVA